MKLERLRSGSDCLVSLSLDVERLTFGKDCLLPFQLSVRKERPMKCIAVGVLLTFGTVLSASGAPVFSDGDFPSANWQVEEVYNNFSSIHTANQELAGGNPVIFDVRRKRA